jgi:heme-degrading monooxygenase HmoA
LANQRGNGKGEAWCPLEKPILRQAASFPGPADMIHISQGNVAVIFVSRRTGADPAAYSSAAAEMEEEVARAPGYLGHDSISGADGSGITISYWQDEASAAKWRGHARHSEVREQGRAKWYDHYRLVVAEISRAYDWHK